MGYSEPGGAGSRPSGSLIRDPETPGDHLVPGPGPAPTRDQIRSTTRARRYPCAHSRAESVAAPSGRGPAPLRGPAGDVPREGRALSLQSPSPPTHPLEPSSSPSLPPRAAITFPTNPHDATPFISKPHVFFLGGDVVMNKKNWPTASGAPSRVPPVPTPLETIHLSVKASAGRVLYPTCA